MSTDKIRTDSTEAHSNNTVLLVISWAIVGIPSLWGVWKVVEKSLNLFTG